MSKIVRFSTAAAIAALAVPVSAAAIAGSGVGAIPDGPAGADNPGAPLVITFAGVADAFSSVDIDITHSWVGDVSATLEDGNGNTAELLGVDGVGFGDSSAFGGVYSFAETGGDFAAAVAAVGFGVDVATGTYASANSVAGLIADGSDWTLTVVDSGAGDPGTVNAATLNTVPEPGSLALLGLGGLALLRRRR